MVAAEYGLQHTIPAHHTRRSPTEGCLYTMQSIESHRLNYILQPQFPALFGTNDHPVQPLTINTNIGDYEVCGRKQRRREKEMDLPTQEVEGKVGGWFEANYRGSSKVLEYCTRQKKKTGRPDPESTNAVITRNKLCSCCWSLKRGKNKRGQKKRCLCTGLLSHPQTESH